MCRSTTVVLSKGAFTTSPVVVIVQLLLIIALFSDMLLIKLLQNSDFGNERRFTILSNFPALKKERAPTLKNYLEDITV